jgi:hypothetical protein
MSDRKSASLTTAQRVWLNHMQCCQARGQSLAGYAKAESLDLKSLYNWRYRLKKLGVLEDASVETSPVPAGFRKVVVARESFGGGVVRLHWPNGRVLEFDSGIDPGYVTRLIEGLERSV